VKHADQKLIILSFECEVPLFDGYWWVWSSAYLEFVSFCLFPLRYTQTGSNSSVVVFTSDVRVIFLSGLFFDSENQMIWLHLFSM
jgi:hypothetical protein